MTNRCLLIQVKGGNSFLTPEKNLTSLIEFAKTFKVEIYLADPAADATILQLKALTAAICDPSYQSSVKCEKLERIFPTSKKNRKNVLIEANKIKSFITTKLLTGKPVSLKELKKKYHDQKLTDACLCHHLTMVRKSLMAEGCEFEKVAAGTYRISNSQTSSELEKTGK
jgi:hypothetical protein